MARERATIPLSERITYVYRAFGARQELIYVGISQSWRNRLEGHRKNSPWWRYVQHVEVQQFDNRAEAFAMESWAIRHELPIANTELQARHCPDEAPGPLVSFCRRIRRTSVFGDEELAAMEVGNENQEHEA